MTKPVFILRWIAVLPGALLAAFLARAFVGVLSFLGDMNPLTWIFTGSSHYGFVAQFTMGSLMGAVLAATFVLSGEWIAPSRKVATRCVLAALTVLVICLWVVAAVRLAALGMPIRSLSNPRDLAELIAMSVVGISLLVKAWRDLN